MSVVYRRHAGASVGTILALLVAQGACAPESDDGTEAADQAPRAALSGPPTPATLAAGEGSAEAHLSSSEDGIVLSWLEPDEGDAYRLRLARWEGDAWSAPTTVTSSERFFVNWADFPSVVGVGGTLVAHWPERGDAGGYDYGVRVATSTDGGTTWSEPWTPHEDDTPTEHGFVSTYPHPDGGAAVVWLDGREYAAAEGGPEPAGEMTLRTRRLGAGGEPGPEVLLDERICDCCQTDAALTSRGPLVVYRDRSDEEIRDISVTRLVDGAWTEGRPVHRDGWEIPACPVNGPATDARGASVAVAWFTAARDTARVNVAFSGDAGATFGPPIRVDAGDPAGRVDVVLLDDGSAVVSWIERLGEGAAEIRVRRVHPDGGRTSEPSAVSAASAARASGFPQMVVTDGRLLLVWTDVAADGTHRLRSATATVAPW